MTPVMTFEQAHQLSRDVVAAYGSQPRTQTLGAWVLATFFPEVFVEALASGRDFYYAQRTSDARLYLSGMLRSGELCAEVLTRKLAHLTKQARTQVCATL